MSNPQKIISWNVNGIRAIAKKGFFDNLNNMEADVVCLQETKATGDQVRKEFEQVTGYHLYTNEAERKGYSGTAIASKTPPISVANDIGIESHDQEGRVITAEYEGFYLVNVYVPNSGSELVRLDYRKGWDADFLAYLKGLEKSKPVLLCGDLNVAHQPIDLARPKSNYNKTSGYTQQEIDGFDTMLKAGFVDTFRTLHPDEVAYSWWSYRFSARKKNIGWRIDYFMASEQLAPQVAESFILPTYEGSDHCPIGVVLS